MSKVEKPNFGRYFAAAVKKAGGPSKVRELCNNNVSLQSLHRWTTFATLAEATISAAKRDELAPLAAKLKFDDVDAFLYAADTTPVPEANGPHHLRLLKFMRMKEPLAKTNAEVILAAHNLTGVPIATIEAILAGKRVDRASVEALTDRYVPAKLRAALIEELSVDESAADPEAMTLEKARALRDELAAKLKHIDALLADMEPILGEPAAKKGKAKR